MASNNSHRYKLVGTNGSEIQLSLNGPAGPAGPSNTLSVDLVTTVDPNTPASATISGTSPDQRISFRIPKGDTGSQGPNTITTNTTTDLIGFIRGDGINVTGATTASSAPTPNTLVLRDASGAAEFFATGKTIFVDAVTGNDTRGTISKYSVSIPFATIAAAVSASATGDLIYVRAGSYPITAQINLNLKGHLYFESGTTVSVPTGIVAFSYSQNNIPIYIKGAADFVLAGTAGVLTIPSGSTAAVAFECNTVSGPNSASGTLFNCAAGVLSVDIKVVQMTTTFTASSATVFNITGIGKVTTRIPFVYCGVFVNGAGAENSGGATGAQINADVWTLATFNGTAGMNLNRVTTNFRMVSYNHVGVGIAFNWTENTTLESHVFRGITWASAPFGAAQMTFNSTAGSTSSKIVSLQQTNLLRGAATNSLSASVPIDVRTYGSFATAPANANVTFLVGSFTVNALT